LTRLLELRQPAIWRVVLSSEEREKVRWKGNTTEC
jgi:hypothetical protein